MLDFPEWKEPAFLKKSLPDKGFALDHEGVEYRLEWIAETAETLPLVALTL